MVTTKLAPLFYKQENINRRSNRYHNVWVITVNHVECTHIHDLKMVLFIFTITMPTRKNKNNPEVYYDSMIVITITMWQVYQAKKLNYSLFITIDDLVYCSVILVLNPQPFELWYLVSTHFFSLRL